jgi:hypothetical protein
MDKRDARSGMERSDVNMVMRVHGSRMRLSGV